MLKKLFLPLVLICYFNIIVFAETMAAESTVRGVMPVLERDYPVQPVQHPLVKIIDPFWTARQEMNRSRSIPFAFEQCEQTGRVENFRAAAGKATPGYRYTVPVFNDTDIYKGIEAASFDLAINPDEEANDRMSAYLDRLIEIVSEAQEPDGYLYTAITSGQDFPDLHSWAGGGKWKNLAMSHELYNAGHLFESASAHYISTGKRNFLDIAIRLADHLVRTFGPEEGQIQDVPGHQVIEMGLVKLYRVTGKKEYLDLARFFVEMRGRNDLRHSKNRDTKKMYGEYAQDHRPLLEQEEAVGHAVRATYYYAGAADVAALTRNEAMISALQKIWENVVSKKLSLNGGFGTTPEGEAFNDNYVIPNFFGETYNETCAQIGGCFWNHRMFLLAEDARYYDVLERTLYNGLASGISVSGDEFFYPNPLASEGNYRRAPWFGCACCPQNLMRFIASLGGYIYSVKDNTLFVGLYIGSEATAKIGGETVRIKMTGDYLKTGVVNIQVDPEQEKRLTLALRIPGWAVNRPVPSDLYTYDNEIHVQQLVLSLKSDDCLPKDSMDVNDSKGFLRIDRVWKPGDVLTIRFPVRTNIVRAHEQVRADVGRIALERGPLLYAFEGVDNANHVFDVMMNDSLQIEEKERPELGGYVELNIVEGAYIVTRDAKTGQIEQKPIVFRAIPYALWANRKEGPMSVWIGTTLETVEVAPPPTLASQSNVQVSFSRGETGQMMVRAINDQKIPKEGQIPPNFDFWPHKGGRNKPKEWCQLDFSESQIVSKVKIYWFDDTGRGECRVPKSWLLYYRDEKGNWEPVVNLDEYTNKKDEWNEVRFEPIETSALRLELELPRQYSSGLFEWVVEP
ncbi:MAG: glycoside hydrolase family 127 protein [Thermoguttaceae bacterium]